MLHYNPRHDWGQKELATGHFGHLRPFRGSRQLRVLLMVAPCGTGKAPEAGWANSLLPESPWQALRQPGGITGDVRRRFIEDQIAAYNQLLPFELLPSTRTETLHRKRLNCVMLGPGESCCQTRQAWDGEHWTGISAAASI